MIADRKDEEAIFYAALEKASDQEREAYIREACGKDAHLLKRVQTLLRAHEEDSDFLKPSVTYDDATLDRPSVAEGLGTIIGHYRLLEKIGEGGMASVYMAEQYKPIRRKVALKIIKLGMDTKEVIARFDAERQALAMMDHPNIAKVFDAGATDTGRPYFVMELVKGVSITEYCDKNRLSTEERLRLFLQVCNAINHAHQKSVIHRDIKPTNVMVTLHDGNPVPKVIDFGIAKATSQRLTEKTLFTRYAQVIGTPVYMSPEQAEMSGLDVDTRTDIYSLGVLLYELLTGTTPFDAEELRRAGYGELQRIIREEEPLKPSTRLSSLGETLTDIAQHRKASPDLLTKLIRGDLDWIVMKALEKDRTRRYETANEFATDIRRYFGSEPVSAGPPSVGYRLSKFVQRNRALVTSTAAVLVVLVAGIVFSTVFAIGQVHARADAERQGRRAQAVADFVTKDLLASVMRGHDSRGDITMSSALAAGAARIKERFEGAPLTEASIREALGNTYRRLGEYEEAQPQLERAYEIRREEIGEANLETLQSTRHLARLYLAQERYDKAQSLLIRTLDTRQVVLGKEHPDTLESMSDLASVYYYQGQYDKAQALLLDSLEIGRRVLGEDDPQNQISMGWLAKVYREQGSNEQSESLYIEMLEGRRRILGEKYKEEIVTSVVTRELIRLYEVWGKPQQAKQYRASLQQLSNTLIFHLGDWDKYSQVLQAWGAAPKREEEVQKTPPVVDYMGKLAEWYYEQGRYEEAEPLYLERLEIQEQLLGKEHPDVLGSTKDLAYLYYHQRRYDKVEELLVNLLEASQRVLGEEDSSTLEIMVGLAALRATCPIPELRDGTRALELATEACQQTEWKKCEYVEVLAASYAELSDFESAAKWQKEALELLAAGEEELRADYESRLRLYQSGKPYRESPLEEK
ncbi:MAG: serine/threonine protein kinase [Sedimentisphaerales bacterium]|nr:serine/threonine protein kinase [Sedimentisphaerales bacterium]